MDEKTLRAYRSVVHPLVSLAVPFTFLLVLDRLLRAMILGDLLPPEPPGFLALLAAAGASEVVTANLLLKRKVGGMLPRLRELLLVLIAGYGILVLTVGDFQSVVSAFVNIAVIYGTVLVLAQWLMTLAIHVSLRQREFFYSLILGKRGAELKNIMREFHDEAGNAADSVRKVKRSFVILQVAVFLLLAAYLLSGVPVAPALIILAIAHEVLVFLAWAVLNHFLEEQMLLGEGIDVLPRLSRRWIGALLAVFVLGILLAVLLTGRQPLVPPSFLVNLLERIGSWFARRLAGNYRPPEGKLGEGAPASEWDLGIGRSPLFAMDQQSNLGSRIVRLIAAVIFGAVGALVLFFIVRPLLSRETRAALRQARPLAALKARLLAVLRGLRDSLRAFVRWLRSPKGAVLRVTRAILGGLRGTAGELRESRGREGEIDRDRRRQLTRSLREFVRIIRWGEQGGVRFAVSMGPLEYAELLGRTVREQEGPLVEVAIAFEEIIFSDHTLEERKIGEFYRKVNGIVRQRIDRR